uniref:F-box domain-containing protein n=1 Tax=Monopterus albus TaxID=43700 RepID=A0A3Q3JHM1_MONAL
CVCEFPFHLASSMHHYAVCQRPHSIKNKKLPPEILIKILSYLDASSLFCISHVNKLFHNDMWRRIYMSDFGRYIWKPKSDDAVFKEDPVEVETQSMDHWKKCYFRTVAGQDISKWLRKLKDTKPRTGLPILTECALRYKTKCTIYTRCSPVHFLLLSVIYNSYIDLFYACAFPTMTCQIACSRVQYIPRCMSERALCLLLFCFCFLTKHIILFNIFYSVSINNKNDCVGLCLVQKSLLGTPCIPYSEPVDRLPLNDSDPEPGLHNYSLNFVLHSSNTKFMTGYYHELSCHNGNLIIVFGGNKHQQNTGSNWVINISNCCIMTLTLQDECQKPFWCISTPIAIKKVKSKASDYSESHFQMIYWDSDGKVKVTLVWLEEQKRLMVISLTVYISVVKINKRFSTLYGTSA